MYIYWHTNRDNGMRRQRAKGYFYIFIIIIILNILYYRGDPVVMTTRRCPGAPLYIYILSICYNICVPLIFIYIRITIYNIYNTMCGLHRRRHSSSYYRCGLSTWIITFIMSSSYDNILLCAACPKNPRRTSRVVAMTSAAYLYLTCI